jgi:hypothetical protein
MCEVGEILVMFVPLELVNEMCTYMRNGDLISMARVCRNWHPTCVRHLFAQLRLSTGESSAQKLQSCLDNFNGHGQHFHVPPRPNLVNAVAIDLNLTPSLTTSIAANFNTLYAVLDQLQHVRHLELLMFLSQDQQDALYMVETVCGNIHAQLPRVEQLTLSCEWTLEVDIDWPTEELEAAVFERMISSYRLTTLTLYLAYAFDGTALLSAQISTLMELRMPLCILAELASGSYAPPSSRLERLNLRPVGISIGDGCLLYFEVAFPTLETLYLETGDLSWYGGEDFGNILYMVSKFRHLKHLELDTSEHLKVQPRVWPITFSHLETLVLVNQELNRKHLRLLASLHWPALTSIRYKIYGIYPSIISRLLSRAPRLEWFTAHIQYDPDFSSGLGEMFRKTEWPNLLGVCMLDLGGHKESILPEHVLAVQRACPNAVTHYKFRNGDDSILIYGVHLSPGCNRPCINCRDK